MLITKQATFAVPLETLWAIIGDPARVDWVPSIKSSSFSDNRRTMRMQGAGTIVEEIFELDPANHLVRYGVVESPAPLGKHQAQMRLEALGSGQTRLHWQTEIEPDEFAGFIEQGMEGGIAGLRSLFTEN